MGTLVNNNPKNHSWDYLFYLYCVSKNSIRVSRLRIWIAW